MLSKVKAQKTRLTNYLVKELGAKVHNKSKTTESEYYELGSMKIRISDHTSNSCSKNCIFIYIPFNDPNTFIVESNYTMSVLKSLKEVKSFLHSLLFIQKLCKNIFTSDLRQELLIAEEKVDQLSFRNEVLETKIKVLSEKDVDKANNIIIINGKGYPLDYFPSNFITKMRNMIEVKEGRSKKRKTV